MILFQGDNQPRDDAAQQRLERGVILGAVHHLRGLTSSGFNPSDQSLIEQLQHLFSEHRKGETPPQDADTLVRWFLETTSSNAGAEELVQTIESNGRIQTAQAILSLGAPKSSELSSVSDLRGDTPFPVTGVFSPSPSAASNSSLGATGDFSIASSPAAKTDTGDFSVHDQILATTDFDLAALDPRKANTQEFSYPQNGTGVTKGTRSATRVDRGLPALEDAIELESIIGRGGMGAVAIGRNLSTGGSGRVAVKFSLSNSPEHQARFATEIENSARLNMQGMLRAESSYITTEPHTLSDGKTTFTIPKGSRCFTTQYVDGITFKDAVALLHQAHKEKSIPEALAGITADTTRQDKILKYFNLEREAPLNARLLETIERTVLDTFSQAARLVDLMNQNNIVHRDLKPENILIEVATGRPYLIDFGLSRDLNRAEIATASEAKSQSSTRSIRTHGSLSPSVDTGLTRDGQVMGTFAYMAPEQASGNAQNVSTKIDTFALGAILFEIYSGHHRIDCSSQRKPIELVRSIVANEEQPLHHVSGSEPRFKIIESLIKKATAFEPSARFSSAADFAREVDNYLDGNRVATFLESDASNWSKTRYRIWEWARNHPQLATAMKAVAAVSTGVAALVGAYGYGSSDAREKVAKDLGQVSRLLDSPRESDWTDAATSFERANGQLRTFGFDPSNWKIISENERALEQIEKTERIQRELLVPFYEAIASTTFDSATYAGNDPTVPPLRALLDKYCPGHDTPGVAEHFNAWLESQGLSAFQERQVRETVGQACWNYALKLPWHPTMGFRNPEDAGRMLVYLRNGREIMGEEILTAPETVAESLLEIRAQEAMGNEERVTEIWKFLEKEETESKTAFDAYVAGKFYQTLPNMDEAAAEFLKGIEYSEVRQRAFLAQGREAEAELEARRIFGLSVGRALSLRGAGNFDLALAESMRSKLVAKSFIDKELSKRCLGIALGVDATIMWKSNKIDIDRTPSLPEAVSPEMISDINSLFTAAIELNPDHVPNWTNAITYFYVSNQYKLSLELLDRASIKYPERAFYVSLRAVVEAHIGEIPDAAIRGWREMLTSKGISVNDIDFSSVNDLTDYLSVNSNVFDLIDTEELQYLARAVAVEGGHRDEENGDRSAYQNLTTFLLDKALDKVIAAEGAGKNVISLENFEYNFLPHAELQRLEQKLKLVPNGAGFFRFD